MKNALLTSLLLVAAGVTAFATDNKTGNAEEKTTTSTKTVVTNVTSSSESVEALEFNSESANYFNVIKNLEVNTFIKLIQLNDYEAVKNLMIAGEDVDKKCHGLTALMYALVMF